MARHPAQVETEIKLRVRRPSTLKRRLAALGYVILKPRVLEVNIVFDTPSGALRQNGKLLRLRQAGTFSTITFKGPLASGPYKSREEIEANVAAAPAMQLILRGLGFAPVFRYEKYRTEYAKPRQTGIIMFDHTPIGDFVELEGAPRWIDGAARALGYSPADYITASYGALYVQHCRDSGVEPGHMVF